MNLKKLIGLLVLLTTICSCTNKESGNESGGASKLVDVSIFASQHSAQAGVDSRTEINSDDWATVNWVENDKIYVWGTSDRGDTYALNHAEFAWKQYGALESEAVFSSKITELSAGTYDYYSTYPKPKAFVGSIVTHNISDSQNGIYDGSSDIMVSYPVSGSAISPSLTRYLDLDFRHLVHALRIEIPVSRNNLGEPVKKMRIDFPTEVVGDLSFDLKDVDATMNLTNGKKRIELNFDTPITDDGNYFWVFIAPTIIDGDITFTSMTETSKVASNISIKLNKNFVAGKITPIRLTIPTEAPKTILEISEGVNNLGETLNRIIATAPEGAIFSNGKQEQIVDINSESKFNLTYYANWCNAEMQSAPISLVLESENAIFDHTIMANSVAEGGVEKYIIPVPYLLYEDFNNLAAFDSKNNNNIWLPNDHGLVGWSGSRMKIVNNCLELETYIGTFSSNIDKQFGRINTIPLAIIKPGKQVKINVSYNISGKLNGNDKDLNTRCVFGTTSKTGIEPGGTGRFVRPEVVVEDFKVNKEGSSSNINVSKSHNVNATSTTRLSWGIIPDGSDWRVDWRFYLFIDNIKVSIVK